jgi:nucleoside-diphosphate-sugar epimerase
MRVFVTGASGFIGRNLCELLLRQGHEVVALYRKPIDAARSEVVLGDLDNIEIWSDQLATVDCVVHLAGRAHILGDQESDPLEAFRKINRDASIRLAEACLERGVRRFVFISSIGVNGNETHDKAFTEQTEAAPQAPYAIAKYEAELGLSTLFTNTASELVIIRPPLVYDGRAPGNFRRLLRLVASGIPVPFGSIVNRRSIISVDSLCGFIVLATQHQKAAGELFLVADEPPLSTAGMVRALALGMNKQCFEIPIPALLLKLSSFLIGKKALYQQLCCSLEIDSTHAQRTLGWMPERNVESGLSKAGSDFLVHTASIRLR